MEIESNWLTELLGTWGDQLRDAAQHLPGMIAGMLVLILGWLVARLARRAVRKLANASNRFLSRTLSAGALTSVRVSPLMISLLGEVFFWVALLISATLALQIAGFGMIANWLDRVSVYLPNLVAAIVILVLGFFLSIFVREQLSPDDAGREAPNRRAATARIAQALVIVVALIVGLDQLGIDVGLLVALAIVCVAGVIFALGATFALGARRYMANLVGMQSIRSQLNVGQWLRIADIEGQVVEITATRVILDTEHGRTLLPGHFLDGKVATILYRNEGGETHHG